MERAAEFVAKNAEAMCPEDTGDLKDSISAEASECGASVKADANCAAYVEFGTCTAAARPFLVPALLNNAAEVRDIIRNSVVAKEG